MQKEDCLELFKRIPEESHAQVNLVLKNGLIVTVETIARFEPNYIVFRGREGGSSDEGRGFFVPYEEITYVKIERSVRIGELKRMFGEAGFVDAEDRLSMPTEPATTSAASPAPAPAATPAPISNPSDPASIAKQNLLERIRAARANIGGSTGKLGNK